jgi:hypothetical protein
VFAKLRKWLPRSKSFLSPEDTDLGNVLKRMGAVTPEQLDTAVALQRESQAKIMLGEALLALKIIDGTQLDTALELQKRMRKSGSEVDAMLDIVKARTERVLPTSVLRKAG